MSDDPKSMSPTLNRCPGDSFDVHHPIGGGLWSTTMSMSMSRGGYGTVQRCPCPWVGGIHVRRTWNRGAHPRSPKDFLDLESPEAEKGNAQGEKRKEKESLEPNINVWLTASLFDTSIIYPEYPPEASYVFSYESFDIAPCWV